MPTCWFMRESQRFMILAATARKRTKSWCVHQFTRPYPIKSTDKMFFKKFRIFCSQKSTTTLLSKSWPRSPICSQIPVFSLSSISSLSIWQSLFEKKMLILHSNSSKKYIPLFSNIQKFVNGFFKCFVLRIVWLNSWKIILLSRSRNF